MADRHLDRHIIRTLALLLAAAWIAALLPAGPSGLAKNPLSS